MATRPKEKYRSFESFEDGFERATLLILGNGVQWKNSERRIFNRVTRKLFGRKRAKK